MTGIRGFWSGKTVKEIKNTKSVLGNCEKCGLNKKCKSPDIGYQGEGLSNILIIGKAPTELEDNENLCFIDDYADVLQEYISSINLDLHKDFYLTYAVQCHKKKTPNDTQISLCNHKIFEIIGKLKPKIIWLLGETAIRSFYSGRFSNRSINRWRDLCIPDRKTGAWIIPTYHPDFIKNTWDGNKKAEFKRSIEFALSNLNRDYPKFDEYEKYVSTLTEFHDIKKVLIGILKTKERLFIAFDYETSNTKPYIDKNQKIWTCSIATSSKRCISFPIDYTGHFTYEQSQYIKGLLKEILLHKNIYKIAHNMQFEDMWSREILDIDHIENWHFCTMNAAHVIDCRSQFCGLKFQSYVNFGVEGYENESAPYMKKLHKGTNINLLDTMSLEKLLMYCGLDSILTFRLYKIQKNILFQRNEPRGSAFRMITMPGLQALSDASITGINMDSLYYQEVTWSLDKQLKELDEYLLNGSVADKFKTLTGRKLTIQKDFSADDIRIILYDILKTKSNKKTAKGLNAADKEVVESIDTEWTKKLIERRKIYKLLNTYIAGFKRVIGIDYKIHPSFPLHIPQSYRGSSFDPNFQNIPNRDETAKAATRKGIRPSEGRRIGCIDYGSQEVNVAAILSQDPKLMWYCTEGNDPHMDVTVRIWCAEKELIPGLLRYHSKSGFVFAEIYGSFYINCAVNMWELCADLQLNNGVNVIDHLVSKGIITNNVDKTVLFKIKGKKRQISQQLYDFIHHVKSVEDWFWGEFSGLRDWQNRMVETYQKKGCVEMPFGFKRTGYLSNNQIFNTAIQGTAFHLLLWSYIQLNKIAKSEWETDLIGQIHDEILFDIVQNELQVVLNTAENIMVNGVRNRFKWANVPLKVEPEVTQINEAWYYKREMIKNDNGIWEYKK